MSTNNDEVIAANKRGVVVIQFAEQMQGYSSFRSYMHGGLGLQQISNSLLGPVFASSREYILNTNIY